MSVSSTDKFLTIDLNLNSTYTKIKIINPLTASDFWVMEFSALFNCDSCVFILMQ